MSTAGASNGSDDTATLQALLTAARTAGGGLVKGKPGASYIISAPLIIGSYTELDMGGCTVTLKAGSNCNMLRGYANNLGSGRDTNITLRGGTYARGANSGTANGLHSLFLRSIDGLTFVGDITYTSSNGKYGIAIGDCTNIRHTGAILGNCSSSLVQLTGPITDARFDRIDATSTDDTFAMCTTDYTAYDDVHGNIVGVTVNEVVGNGPTRCVLISGSASGASDGFNVSDITVNRVKQNGAGEAVCVASPSATTERIDNITLRHVSGGRVHLLAVTMGQVTVEDSLGSKAGDQLVAITPETNTTNIVERLVLRRCRATAGNLVYSASTATTINEVHLDQCDIAATSAGSAFVFGNATVGIASATDLRYLGTSDVAQISAGSVSTMVFERLTGSCATTMHVIRLTGTGSLDVASFIDPIFTAADVNSGILVNKNATTATINTVKVRGGKLTSLGRCLEVIVGSSGTITLQVADLTLSGCSRIAQVAGATLNAFYSNVVVGCANEPYRILNSGTLNIRGDGWSGYTTSAAIRAGSEVIHVIAKDFPVDLSILAKTAGDMASNTNASTAPFVTGPAITDGTSWRNLTTLATKSGTAVLVGGTVTVADTAITANSVIRLSHRTVGGTPGALYISAKSASTSFTITSTSGTDTSTVYYEIVSY